MASIHKRQNSPFWWGAFTLPSGKRAFRSTKCLKRGDALKVCIAWESAAQSRSTDAQIRRVFSDLHRAIHGRAMELASVASYAEQWLKRKTGETAKATLAAYTRASQDFIRFIGDRAHSDIASITPAEIAACRDSWAATGAPKTVNNKLKAIRVMFQNAWRDGIIVENPAAKVPTLKETEKTTRRLFTVAELKKILGAAKGEWQGVILAGLYTGQRLGDIVRLRWNQVDLVEKQISLTTSKTGRRQIIPIAEPLLAWLNDHAGDEATGPVFSKLHGMLERGGSSPLSQDFHDILVTAGMATEREINRDKTGPGRRARRPRGELTFHSLRHTATSWLKAAGVSEAVARDIIGHDSAEVSRHYTHASESDKAAAVARLPKVS
ncbi:MAG: tyrosine-type recombinase/integrase [Opitutaceae bacterium]|nr:tyrosine-type recombinase/integrase [Opitutaceae bacterium]